jgi:hypothetical protein
VEQVDPVAATKLNKNPNALQGKNKINSLKGTVS